MRRSALRVVAVALLALVTGCANAPSPTDVTDAVIRAVGEKDVAGIRAAFEPDVRPSITASSVNDLFNVMRRIGLYRTVYTIAKVGEGRYDLVALFDRGALLVRLRLRPDGEIAAMHFLPRTTPSTDGAPEAEAQR